ncbi:MAG TPA: FAD-dependent oxidoreductase, partial [Candidatus Acidoferrales bacterium]
GRASMAMYADFVSAVEDASGKSTGYRTGGAVELICHGDVERELSTLVALHHGLGLACEALPLDDLRNIEPLLGRNARAAALLPDECSINPRKLASAVLAAMASENATLCPGVEATSLCIDGKKCVGVRSSGGEIIHAAQVVLAAGCWSSLIPEAAAFAPTAPVRGQLAALRYFGTPIRHVLRSENGYIVPRGMESPQTVVVGSTLENAGYEKRVTSGGIEKILSAANEIVAELAGAEIVETWSGLRPGTPDQLPILGPTDIEGLVIATGHYRNGILLAPITAKLVGEWIEDRRTSLDWEAYSPMRFLRTNEDRSASA